MTTRNLLIYFPVFFCSLLLLTALFTDIRSKTIPNIITVPAIICGVLFNTWNAGCSEGFLFAVKGLVAGGGLLIIPFVLGGMGGGDVKLFAALGSWLGCPEVLEVYFYGAATGAVIALFLVFIKNHRLKAMSVLDDIVYFILTKERPAKSNEVEGFRYSVPVAAGFVAYVIFR